MASRLENKATMCGYLATEVTVMGKDKNVARFRIRHDKSKKVGDKWEKEASFFTVVCFGADNAEKVSGFQKGEQVLLSGSLKQNQREDKEYVDIIADVIALTDPPSGNHNPDPSNDDDWLNS